MKRESFEKLCRSNVLVLSGFKDIKIEAGTEVEYNESSLPELRQVPLQLRDAVVSYPEGAEITVQNLDTSVVGPQIVTFISTTHDGFKQKSSSYQNYNIEIVDSYEPEIVLASDSVVCDGTFNSIKNNVISVTDKMFGEYTFSKQRENHTWWIDTHWMNYCKKGKYTATVYVNDNGVIVGKDFEVIITKNRDSVYR